MAETETLSREEQLAQIQEYVVGDVVAAPPTIQPNAHGLIGIKGVLTIEGEITGDKRLIEPDAVYWEEGPWSLMSRVENDGHKGAPLVGRIDQLARMGSKILFSGVIDVNTEAGPESVRLIGNKLLRGISLDPDMYEAEFQTPDGRNIDDLSDDELDNLDWESIIMVMTQARVRGGTMLPMPAFVDTELELFEVGAEVASALPAMESNADCLPPASWFENPDLKEPTPLTITKDGHIFGHIVESWNQCHIGISGVCAKPPRSNFDYAFFTRGAVRAWCSSCGREELIATGPITAGTGHATLSMTKQAAVSHYDNSGYRVADVAAGEDAHGIWISGRIAPDATKEQVDSLLALGVSGDWRRQNGSLELVAILSVPVPGFPIKRKTLVAGGVQLSLVTAPYGGSGTPNSLTEEVSQLKKITIGLLTEQVLSS